MTSLGLAAAAAVLLAGAGASNDAAGPVPGTAIETGTAYVLQVKHGYFRRDLGLDPAYSNFRHNQGEKKGPRGFRQDAVPYDDEAGIQLYDDGSNGYIGRTNGLRIDHNDPGLRGK